MVSFNFYKHDLQHGSSQCTHILLLGKWKHFSYGLEIKYYEGLPLRPSISDATNAGRLVV